MVEIPNVGTKAPDFSVLNQNGENINLKDLNGKWVVMYFYPKDDTPGCTIEANEFTSLSKNFEKENAIIFGISPDDEKSPEMDATERDLNPKKKNQLPTPNSRREILLSPNPILGTKNSTLSMVFRPLKKTLLNIKLTLKNSSDQ